MTQREIALSTLTSIASSPGAVEESTAHLFAAVDALAAVFMTADRSGMPARQAALRTPAAVWAAVQNHAEHRAAQAKAAAKAAA